MKFYLEFDRDQYFIKIAHIFLFVHYSVHMGLLIVFSRHQFAPKHHVSIFADARPYMVYLSVI